MIQEQAILNVADNSGACRVMCVRVLGGSHRRYTGVGDIIEITIKEVIPRDKVKKSNVLKMVMVCIKRSARRLDGSVIRFDGSAYVLLDNNSEQPIGTRVFEPVTRKFRNEEFMKITSLVLKVL